METVVSRSGEDGREEAHLTRHLQHFICFFTVRSNIGICHIDHVGNLILADNELQMVFMLQIRKLIASIIISDRKVTVLFPCLKRIYAEDILN